MTSVLVAIYSLRFALVPFDIWFAIGNTIRQVVETVPLLALTHMILAPVALLLGPFQFWTGFRRRRSGLHRLCGRVYIVACIVSGLAALAAAPYAPGGPVAGVNFNLLAVMRIASTGGAWYAATQKNLCTPSSIDDVQLCHDVCGCYAAPSNTCWHHVFAYSGYTPLSVWLAYTSWIPNVLAVYCYLLYESRTARQVTDR